MARLGYPWIIEEAVKIHITNIPEEGSRIEFVRDEGWFAQQLPEKDRQEMVLDSVQLSGTVRRMHEAVFFDGKMTGALKTSCSLCLEPLRLPISASFRYTFIPAKSEQKEEVELSAEDLEYGFYEGEIIDLDPVLFEQILLQMPMRVLCRDECRGLCTHCGINLNTGSCSCRDDHMDERLAVLKSFKVKPKNDIPDRK
jgi:uncharacterized protein